MSAFLQVNAFYVWENVPKSGGYSSGFLLGVCRPVLQILTRFQTKKCYFSHPFSDQTSKNYTFQTHLQVEIMLSFFRLERKQTNSSNPFRVRIFLFLSYSFGIETINAFIHSCSSLENHARFQTKTMQEPYPMGRHIPIQLI